MTKWRRVLMWIMIIGGGGLSLYLTIPFIYMSSIFLDLDSSSYKELAENYELKKKELADLKSYINSIVPTNKSVDIEFDGNENLEIFHVTVDGINDRNWNIKVNSGRTDTLLQKLFWTKETLNSLKIRLENANCISVSSGDPCRVGFRRSGMGMYFYDLFSNPIADSLRADYNDSCNYVIYNDKVVFEYGGGAIGPQCFPDF